MNDFIIPGKILKPGCHTEHHKIHQTDQSQYLGGLSQKRLLYIINEDVQNSTGVEGGGGMARPEMPRGVNKELVRFQGQVWRPTLGPDLGSRLRGGI